MDWCLYKYRHLVENMFARIKHSRAIATRDDKRHAPVPEFAEAEGAHYYVQSSLELLL